MKKREPGPKVAAARRAADRKTKTCPPNNRVARTTRCPGAEIETSIQAQEAAVDIRTEEEPSVHKGENLSATSRSLREPGQQVVRAAKKKPAAPRVVATSEPPSKASAAMHAYWADIRAGRRPDPRGKIKERPVRKSENPLLDLPEEQRSKLFAWLRECPYDDAVQVMLRDQGLPDISRQQLDNFFQLEAEGHWEKRIGRAAEEANALVRLVEKSPAKYSAGILAALGQEVFRQIASGEMQPDNMGKLATLFLRARSDERADQMQELKREKLRHELGDQLDQAFEELARQVERHPAAREAFEALRHELAEYAEENQ